MPKAGAANEAALAAKRAEIAARVAAARAQQQEQSALHAAVTPISKDVASLCLLKRDSGNTEWAFAERPANSPPAARMHEPLCTLEAVGRMAGADPSQFWWWIQDEALDAIAREVERSNFCVLDGFLGPAHLRRLREEVTGLHRDGKLQLSKLAGGRTGGILTYSHTAVRGDHVGWFDGEEGEGTWPGKSLSAYLQKVDTLVAQLGERSPSHLGSIAHRSKAMVACYPGGGARYVRHCDNSCDSGEGERCNGRRLTAILYLNENWTQLHGGELRLFPPFAKGSALCDVAPLADRLILFYADYRVPHEVLPAHVPRLAVTLWYFDKLEHARARSKGQSAEQTDAREAEAIEAEIARFEERFGSGAVVHGDLSTWRPTDEASGGGGVTWA